jgi:hypothetical protein
MGKDAICAKSWGRDARHVMAKMERKVFERYGLTGNADKACKRDAHGRRCEIDHLVSRELGGADDVLNLWPQPYGSSHGMPPARIALRIACTKKSVPETSRFKMRKRKSHTQTRPAQNIANRLKT